MTPRLDLSKWLTDEQVSARLGISQRTLFREVAAGKWQPQMRQRDGKRPERVFSPEEVEARMPSPPTVLVRRDPDQMPPMSPEVAEMAELPPVTWPAIVDLVQGVIASASPAPQTVWVKLKEASAITGISVKALIRLVRAGEVPGIFDNAFKLRRDGLENLNVSSLAVKTAKKGKR